MATERKLAGKRLPLTIAFTVLLVAAFGAGCSGFFINNTLESVAVQPSSASINVNATQTFSLWGTYQDGTRSQITSGVVWTTSDSTIVSLNNATGTGVTPGTATISGSAQGLSGTASITVVGDVTSIIVSPTTATLTVNGSGQAFTFTASPGPPGFITVDNGGTLNISPVDSYFSCIVGVDGNNNPAEVCSATQGAAAQYTLSMSYLDPSGNTITSNTATINVH
jgi:hypothetical protein